MSKDASKAPNDPLIAGLDPEPPNPNARPAEEYWQRYMLRYWRAQGITPSWAKQVDADHLVKAWQLRHHLHQLRGEVRQLAEVIAALLRREAQRR